MSLPSAARTFVWLVALCFFLELGARYFYPLSQRNVGETAARNEISLRNWPEYISGSADYDELMVYISNSQAVGSEYADSGLIYPSLMQSSLRKTDPGLRLENWAMTGINAEQIELFILQAEKRKAKYLVLAVSLINFDSKHNYRFGRDRSDLSLIVGDISFWTKLKHTFIGSFIDWDNKLSSAFMLYSRLGRMRVLLFDTLAEEIKRPWHRVLFGHTHSRSVLKSIAENADPDGPDERVKIRKITSKMSAKNWGKSFRNSKLPRLDAVYTQLRKRLFDSQIDLLWIWVPAGANQYNQAAIEGQQSIVADFCNQVINDGWACEDLTQALPASNFLPSTFSSHLNLQGHQNQAALITPIIRRVIH